MSYAYFPTAIMSHDEEDNGKPFLWNPVFASMTLEEALDRIERIRKEYIVYHAWVDDENNNVVYSKTYVNIFGDVKQE